MIWLQFPAAALVVVAAGVRLARYGDVIGEKTRLAAYAVLRGDACDLHA